MKRLSVASIALVSLLGLAACNDKKDENSSGKTNAPAPTQNAPATTTPPTTTPPATTPPATTPGTTPANPQTAPAQGGTTAPAN